MTTSPSGASISNDQEYAERRTEMAEAAMKSDAFVDAIVSTIKRSLEQPQARIAALEQRIAQLEAAPKGLTYTGTWQRAAEYRRHQGVTHKSQLWVVVSDATRDEPGTSGACNSRKKKGPDDAR